MASRFEYTIARGIACLQQCSCGEHATNSYRRLYRPLIYYCDRCLADVVPDEPPDDPKPRPIRRPNWRRNFGL